MSKPPCNCLSVRFSGEVRYFESVSIALVVTLGRVTDSGAHFHPVICSLSYSGNYMQLKVTAQMEH